MGERTWIYRLKVPTNDPRIFDLSMAGESQSYCDDLRLSLANRGVEITELSTHIQGQLVALHPAYDELFDGFAPEFVRGNATARQAWVTEKLEKGAKANELLDLKAYASFSGPWLGHILSVAPTSSETD